MKKLFLSSYFSGVAKLLPALAGNELKGKNVIFIPTASVVEKVTFYVGADKKSLARHGFAVDELEISTASKKEIKNKIANAEILFVEGGNTFFLLQELKRTGASELIKEHIEKGKIYIGSSAGSIITSPNIGDC